MRLRQGDKVWLKAFPGSEDCPPQPRERAEILEDYHEENTTLIVFVETDDPHDDGLREITPDIIEGWTPTTLRGE